MKNIVTELYIDLGTANTLIYIKNKGFILNEPSAITLKSRFNSQEIFAIGAQAKSMIGKTPLNMRVNRPLKEGVIADFNNTEKMLHAFLSKVKDQTLWMRPKMVISLPCKVTNFERKAVEDVGLALGASKVKLIQEPVAAAIGAGLSIFNPTGHIVVDIGGGTTEIAVISMGGIVYANAVRVGGDELDSRIQDFIRNKYNFLIGEQTAEKLKINLASAVIDPVPRFTEVKGLDLYSGLPKRLKVSDHDIHMAINETVKTIIHAIRVALEHTPPELASDLVEKGLVLAGGGALLSNLDKRIKNETGLNVTIAKNPLFSVAYGGAMVLEREDLLEKIAV